MNRIKTDQVTNNLSKFMKLSHMNFHELAMNRIKTDQVNNTSTQFLKLSPMNFMN